jgi:hypothetical protein
VYLAIQSAKEKRIFPKKPCACKEPMTRRNEKQLQFKNFEVVVGGKLRGDNRWIKLANLIP